jgi:predicted transcriptional regulator
MFSVHELPESRVHPELDLLERISTFVLNRTSENFRLELHEHLVMMALSDDKTGKGIRKEQIISSLEKELQVEGFPPAPVQAALDHLVEKNAIKKIRGGQGDLYFLVQDERTRIALMEEQYSKMVSEVKSGLIKRMKEKGISLDMNEEAIVFATFRSFISVGLSELGKECCSSLISSHGKDVSVFKPVNLTGILNDVLGTVESEDLRRTEREVFIESILDPNEAMSDLLYSLAQSYFFVQILHLDPECQQLDVIHHSLTGIDRRNKAVDYALRLTASLGVSTVLSKRTKEEFIDLLESRKTAFGKDPKIPNSRFEKVSNNLEDGFLKDYLKKKAKSPNLTFDRYADRLEEIASLLNNRYNTVLDESDHKEILEVPDIHQLEDIVVEEGTAFGLQKSGKVAEHDAFHILLIQELRKNAEEDILGPDFWFLTHDRSLPFVEKRYGKYRGYPSSIFVDNWVQLMSPLVSPKQTKEARDAYIGLFASRLPLLSGAIDEEAFAAFQGKWIDDEDLKPNEVARIIGNRYIKDTYEEAKKTKEPISDEDKEKMVSPIIAEIRTQNRNMAWMKREITDLRKGAEELRTKLNKVEKLSKRQGSIISRLGHPISALVFLALSLILFEFFRVQGVQFEVAISFSILLAAIAGALADLKGYKWLVDRLLRYKGSEQSVEKSQENHSDEQVT